VCVDSGYSWIEGRGECVRLLPSLPDCSVLLVNPGVQISTAQVFAALGPRRGLGLLPPQAPFLDVYDLVRFLRDTINDLETPARTIAPVIAEVLCEMNDLQDILLARMSGSGATCFALFADQKTAREAARLLRARHPKWWITETVFRTAREN